MPLKPLRVVAGSACGLRLRSVPGDKTRPITDRASFVIARRVPCDAFSVAARRGNPQPQCQGNSAEKTL